MGGRDRGVEGRAAPQGSRSASSRTALIVGVLAAAALSAFAPILALADEFSLSNFGTPFLIELPYVAVGFLVARRQPRNPIGWLALAVGGTAALSSGSGYYAWYVYGLGHRSAPLGSVALVLGQVGTLAVLALPLVILLFPDGRLPSRRWRWAVVTYVGLGVIALAGPIALAVDALIAGRVNAHTVSPGGTSLLVNQPAGTAWLANTGTPFFVATALLIVAAVAYQVVSYRRSTGVRRQQLKSLMAGGAVLVLAVVVFLSGTANGGSSPVAKVWSQVPWLAFSALPISIGVAIMRFRLYDIDRIVSRTLSYAILTALLAGTFIGVVALTTNTLALSGRVGVAASTLAAAALFNPLRIRIQRVVDRRFNRAGYDTESMVAAFTARLRDAVEIDTIRAELLDAVNRAVEPSHASVWIKP